jgi:hypothetical protein
MDLSAKHAELTAALQQMEATHARACKAVEEAALAIARLQGALSLVNELRQESDGHA